jgi:hypothetical protein
MSVRGLEEAVCAFLKQDRAHPYRVRRTDSSEQRRVISVAITLPAGSRFCCGEPGCHLGLFLPDNLNAFEHVFVQRALKCLAP